LIGSKVFTQENDMIRKSMILTALGVALLATPAFAQSAPSNKSDTDTGATQSQQMNPAGSVAPASPNNEQSAGAGGINGPRGVSGTSPSQNNPNGKGATTP